MPFASLPGQSRFGAGARKMRFTVSRGQGTDVPGTFVLTTFFTHSSTDANPFHQTLHSAVRHLKAFSRHLMSRLTTPADLITCIPDPFDFRTQLRIPLMSRRSFGRISEARQTVAICPLPADCYAIAGRSMDGAIGRSLQIDPTP
jgi:hypothetical protein